MDLRPGSAGLFDLDVHTFHAHGDQPTHRHYDLRFCLRAAGTDRVPGPEVRDARWVHFADL